MEIPNKALNLLNSLTNLFFRTLFRAPKGNPLVLYFWDTGSLLNENFLILQKLLLLHHLISLPNDSLAKEVVLQQREESLGGLLQESDYYLEQLDIKSDPVSFSKTQWAKLVKSRIHSKNKSDILKQISSYKKFNKDKLVTENYGMKPYISSMSIADARTFFSSRSMMLSTVQYNFKNHPEYKANAYKCKCGDLDTQSNLLTCKLYSHLREGLDLSNSDKDLVRYYQLVIQDRQQEKEQRQQRQ